MENKENEFIKDVELNIFAQLINLTPNNKVEKITFTTDKGDKITCKPQKTEKVYFEDFATEKSIMPEISELNSIFHEIAKELKKSGKVKVKASYNIWNKDVDGQIRKIRYVQSNTVNGWEIIE